MLAKLLMNVLGKAEQDKNVKIIIPESQIELLEILELNT